MYMTWAWLLCLCLSATLMACGDDDDDNTVPESVTASMEGRYNNFLSYGGKLTTNVMTVTVNGTQATATVPYSEILTSDLTGDYNEAMSTLQGDDVTFTFRPIYYNGGVASYLGNTQTLKFSYTVDGKKTSGTLTVKMPTLAYNSASGKLTASYTVSDLVLNGATVDSFKASVVSMRESEKKN